MENCIKESVPVLDSETKGRKILKKDVWEIRNEKIDTGSQGEEAESRDAQNLRIQFDGVKRRDSYDRGQNQRETLNRSTGEELVGVLEQMKSEISIGSKENFLNLLHSLNMRNLIMVIGSDHKTGDDSRHSAREDVLLLLKKIRSVLDQRGIPMMKLLNQFDDFTVKLLLEGASGEAEMYQEIEIVLPLLSSVDSVVSGEDRVAIVGAVEKHLTENMFSRIYYSQPDGWKTVERLVRLGSEKAVAYVSEVIEKGIGSKTDFQVSTQLTDLLWDYGDKPFISELAFKIVGRSLHEEFNVIDGESIIRRWQSKNTINLLNLYSMREIERKLPGSVKLLNESYGICEFARYPVELLVEQVKNHNKDVPYGVAMFPEKDETDAFDEQVEILQQLYDDTRGKHLTRVYEISRESSIRRFLVAMRLKYPKEKISYLILVGHGEEKGMEFSRKSSLDKDVLERSSSMGAIKDMFIQKPSVALFSCSTGADDGFAQFLSEKLEASVKAPKTPAGSKSLRVIYDNHGKPALNPKYIGEQVEYLCGKKVQNPEIFS
ncbi:MAG: DUF4347 domain-containing protein [Candidatus Moranbacteria bacterium]|nr:DUF4347 domain-containing protein [Candidatus Moranbacteria bacterium]